MIRLENISKYYHSDGIVTLGLRKINLEFKVGEFIALTGESGSGKSTLLNVITGIDSYEDGELYIDGEETSHFDNEDWEKYRKDSVGFIFQDYNLIESYSVLRNVEVALIIQGFDKKTRKAKAKEILERVGLLSHIKNRASKLSGGQKQRLSIARALAKNTKIIVADEPTGNLDSESGKQVLKLLHEIAQDHLVIIVTHNYDQAAPFVTRKIRLFDGEVIEDKSLHPVDNAEFKTIGKSTVPNLWKSAIISKFNILSQPKKTMLIFLVVLVTTFFIFSAYGTYLNIKAKEINYNYNELNVFKERVILKRMDANPLLEEDFELISSYPQVDKVIKADLMVDLKLYTDFTFNKNRYQIKGNLGLINNLNPSDIIGRFPTSPDEILISTAIYSEDLHNIKFILNRELLIHFEESKISHFNFFKIVGIHLSEDLNTRFFLHEQALTDLNHEIKISNHGYSLNYQLGSGSSLYRIRYNIIKKESSLQDNQIVIEGFNTENYPNTLKIIFNGQEMEIVQQRLRPNFFYQSIAIFVSEEVYNTLLIEEDAQYSVILKDYKESKATIASFFAMGYYAFSPYDNRPVDMNVFKALLDQMVSYLFVFIPIIVIYLIFYLIMRTVMISKKRDYTILRTIGVEKSQIKTIISFEIVMIFLIAYITFYIIYFLLHYFFPEIFNPMVKQYLFKDYVIVTVINFLIIILSSRRLNNLFSKKSLLVDLKME